MKPLAARVVSALTCVMVWGTPLVQAQVTVPKIIEYKLPTGQTLYIKEDHSQPIVTVDTWVKTGSVNETAPINGVSHFLEHLLFKGTEKYPGKMIDRMLESRGAEFNAATSDDYTHYYITTASPYFEEALRLHADMLLNATIPPDELTQERKVVQEEINRANDNPQRQLYTALAQRLYGSHGYALDTLGPKEVIANVPREDILGYYHYWYQPQNFNTIIAGDVDPEQIKKLVEASFPAPRFKRPPGYNVPTYGKPTPPTQPQTAVLTEPGISQAYTAFGFLGPTLERERDVYAMDIAMLALGAGRSSRLYQTLKEQKPLVNSVGASNYTQRDAGMLLVYAETQPENVDVVKREIIDQLNRLKQTGITEDELEKAKTQYLKDFIFQNETTDGVAQAIGYNVTIGSLDDYLGHVENVRKVSLDDVQAALDRYIQFNQAVLVDVYPESNVQQTAALEKANLELLQQAAQSKPVSAVAVSSEVKPTTMQISGQIRKPFDVSDVEEAKLSNGMTALLKPNEDSATVSLKLFAKGGQAVEPIPGTAALAAALLTKGTESRTASDISRELESKGINLAISPNEDYLEITGTAVEEDLGELVVILRDLLNNSTFDPAEIEKQKENIRQAIMASRDNPSSVAFENLSMAMYPWHPYGNAGQRVLDHLDLIKREHIVQYLDTVLQSQNVIGVVAGNFDAQITKNYLQTLLPKQTGTPTQVSIPAVTPLKKAEKVVSEQPKLSATWMAKGWLAPAIEHEDYAALKVLNSLLGTGMSSRLFVNLRDKEGLAYTVGSYYPSRAEDSRFVMFIGTDPQNKDRVLQGFEDEIRQLQETPVPEAELAEARSKLIGSYALAHDTNSNQAFYLGMYEALGVGYEYDALYPRLIDAVTAADVQRVAKRYFSGPSVTSLVIPKASP